MKNENEQYLCTKDECSGMLDTSQRLTVQTGCYSHDGIYPCSVCGRMHQITEDGRILVAHSRETGQVAYLKDLLADARDHLRNAEEEEEED